MARWPGGLPTLFTQLDTGAKDAHGHLTEGEDCGPSCCVNVIVLASGGKVGPRFQHEHSGEERGSDMASWIGLVREWAGNDTNPFMMSTDFMDALTHPDLARLFQQAGLPRLRPQAYSGGLWETLKKNARADYPVILAVHYGVLADGRAPVGSSTFRKGHVVVFAGLDSRGRKAYVNDGDPLFDGRRAGIPDGYVDTRLVNFRRAAARFGDTPPGTGKADFIVVRGGAHR